MFFFENGKEFLLLKIKPTIVEVMFSLCAELE